MIQTIFGNEPIPVTRAEIAVPEEIPAKPAAPQRFRIPATFALMPPKDKIELLQKGIAQERACLQNPDADKRQFSYVRKSIAYLEDQLYLVAPALRPSLPPQPPPKKYEGTPAEQQMARARDNEAVRRGATLDYSAIAGRSNPAHAF
jgi:hypothetical protein